MASKADDMNILFYTDTPNVGGAEKQMSLLAKTLRAKGIAVGLAYGKYSALGRHPELLSEYDQVFVLNAAHKHDPRHYFELRRIFEMGEIPRRSAPLNDMQGFDLVHLHLWNPGACRYAFVAASGGVPIVATEHDPFELRGFKRWIKRACLRRTAHTIAISNGGREKMMRWYGLAETGIMVVHNGITPCHSESAVADEESPQSLNSLRSGLGGDSSVATLSQNDMSARNIRITCIAELHERKGHRYLIEAFLKLQPRFPNWQLQLVGGGPLEGEFKRRYGANPNIHILGWQKDAMEILRQSDLFVLPSLREAFGLVVLEAMASGVAVIATACDGPRDIIEDGKNGLLVPPANAEALAQAMERLLTHPEEKRALEEAAQKRVLDFSAERMAEETMRVYSNVTLNPAGVKSLPVTSNLGDSSLRSE